MIFGEVNLESTCNEAMAKNDRYALTALFNKENDSFLVWTDYSNGDTIFTITNTESDIGVFRPIYYALSGKMDVYKLKCPDGVIELHYGPLSSGLWEAGAFNVLTYGERILNITPDLGYKTRNIEEKVIGRKVEEALFLLERLCGNYSVAYSTAFCNAIEKGMVPDRAEYLRHIALELERLQNHFHSIQRLTSAASQKVAASHFSALVEEILRLNAKLFHHRYAFGINVPGGVRKDIKDLNILTKKLNEIEKDFEELVELLLSSRIFIDRVHNTAILSKNDILRLDAIGITAKGSGVKRDVRTFDSFYSDVPYRIVCKEEGDSLARMIVRIDEIRNTFDVIRYLADKIPQTSVRYSVDNANFDVGLSYGRAEAAHGDVFVVVEIKDGIVKWAGIRPASLINYVAFAHAVKGNIFTDFPFAIESFGLSFADSDK